jgi:hypothetical protein
MKLIGGWYFVVFLFVFFSGRLVAQPLAGDQRVNEIIKLVDKDTIAWTYGSGIGLDMRSLMLINPRVGSGQSQIGFGIIWGGLAKYNKDKLTWYNTSSVQLAAQKIGTGNTNPWIKNIDIFRINSKLSYAWESELFSNAVDFTLQSILLPTYSGNKLRPKEERDRLVATFFSPATINFSPGIEYKPNDKFHFLISPAGFKGIFILNQGVANLDIYNTRPILNEMGDTLRFSRSDLRFGNFLRSTYKDKFLNDALIVQTTLDLFSNYLRNPENIDILWRTEFNYRLFKNLFLNLNTEFFYDNDVLVQVDKEGTLGLKPSFTSALYIKYNHVF